MKRCLLLLVLGFCSYLQALPTSGKVVKGEAYISKPHSKAININAHGKAVIHWDQFDIDSSESVSFVQSQPKMAVLNRVTGGSLSKILGHLKADCPIYLINGKGIFIGDHAQIHTAGFIASTADISNESFWGQKDLAFQNLKEGEIINLGTISCTEGDVVLIARSITNSGVIRASQGWVTLTTTEIVIHPNEKKQVFVRIEEPAFEEEGIENKGEIEASSIHFETESPYAHAIHHSGVMKTFTTTEEGGRIFLTALQGGTEFEGKVAAPAGSIAVMAQDISVHSSAVIDTSSNQSGGFIDLQGAETVQVDKGVKLLASSLLKGDGGEIHVFSNEKTYFFGEALARGGSLGGNGGTIDISTKGEHYRMGGKADTHAPNGRIGHITFDPKFVTIQPSGDPISGYTVSFSDDPSGTAIISGSSLQEALASGNVTIQANTDITFDDTVAGTFGDLTLQAGRSILFEGELTLGGSSFTAEINASESDGVIGLEREDGVAVFAMSGMGNSSKIETQGGNITVSVGNFGGQQEGEVYLSGGIIDAGGGNISVTGFGRLDPIQGASGIMVSSDIEVKTNGLGTITYQGTGGSGPTESHGIVFSENTAVTQSENGQIYLLGIGGGGDGSGSMNSGIVHAGTVVSTGSGPIYFEGTATAGIDLNTGVCFISGGSVSIKDGGLTLTGIGKGTGNQNYGIRFDSSSRCSSTGLGQIQLTGSTSGGVDNNHGIILSNSFIQSSDGAISIQGTGQGTGNYNYGTRLETMASVTSSNGATISIQGNNSSGVMGNIGVAISSTGRAISSENGDIHIIGASSGTGTWNEGFRLDGGVISSSGDGTISIQGTASPNGTNWCTGVDIGGYQVEVVANDGDVNITGFASNGNDPYIVTPNSAVHSVNGDVNYN